MEFGLLEPGEATPFELYMLDMVAMGNVVKDMPNPNPKSLEEDIKSKWKTEEMEYQLRKGNANSY